MVANESATAVLSFLLRSDNMVREGSCILTFAISLQEFPASLICFNLSSSAGVHGVFVRLFLSFGSCAGASLSAAWGTALLASTSAPRVELVMSSGGWFTVTDLRFRFVVDVSGGGALACDSWPAVVTGAGCKLGSSVVAGYGELRWSVAAIGEGLRVRVAEGEELWNKRYKVSGQGWAATTQGPR
jgi:hypothetical protein